MCPYQTRKTPDKFFQKLAQVPNFLEMKKAKAEKERTFNVRCAVEGN
jgi:hypothetical protein